jgi:hypothetical protein
MGKKFYNISPASMFLSEAIISLETKGLRRLRSKKKTYQLIEHSTVENRSFFSRSFSFRSGRTMVYFSAKLASLELKL